MTTYREGYISENVSESFKLVYARSLQSIQVPVNSFLQLNILHAKSWRTICRNVLDETIMKVKKLTSR
jgi:hypothetical protein